MWPWWSVLLELPQQNIEWVSQRAEIYFLTFWGWKSKIKCWKGWFLMKASPRWACTWPCSHCVLIWPFPIYVERQWSLVSSSSKGEALHAPSLGHDNTSALFPSLFPWPLSPYGSASAPWSYRHPTVCILFSIVAVAVYFPINSVGRFPFLHTLSSIYCLQSFGLQPFWLAWSGTSLWFWFAFLC